MMPFPLRILLVSGVCAGLAACAQPAPTPMGGAAAPPASLSQAAQSPSGNGARVCTTRGRPANAGVSDTWSITVSNEGRPCGHTRELGRQNETYQVLKPPMHGQIAQSPQGGKTRVTYTPTPGYTGSDAFSLRYTGRNMEMPYLVNVIP